MIYKIVNLRKLSFILTTLIPFIYILFNDYEDFGKFYKINLIVLYLINLLPFFYIYLNKEEKDIVPIFQLILIYFFICYSSFFIFDIWGWYYGDLSGAVSGCVSSPNKSSNSFKSSSYSSYSGWSIFI